MNDLMAELDAMVEEQRSAKGAKPKAKAKHLGIQSSPAEDWLTNPQTKRAPIPPTYTPVPHQARRRIFIVREQECNRCGARHPVLAGEFIEFAWAGGLNTHRAIVAPGSDHTFDWLPKEVEWLEPEAVTCPDCLMADILVSELALNQPQVQLPLFPWSEHGPSA